MPVTPEQLLHLLVSLEVLKAEVGRWERSREASQIITKLDEARLWASELGALQGKAPRG